MGGKGTLVTPTATLGKGGGGVEGERLALAFPNGLHWWLCLFFVVILPMLPLLVRRGAFLFF